MEAERLFDVVNQVSQEMKDLDVPAKLATMVSTLEQMISSPNATHDAIFKAALDALYSALEAAPSNDWVPTKRKLLAASGLSDVIGRGLRKTIEKIFAENVLTRQTALERLRELTVTLKKRLIETDQTVAALTSMGVTAPTIPEGQAEVAFILPDSIDTKTLVTVEKELDNIDKLLRLLSEVHGEPIGSAQVLSISKGTLEVYVVASYAAALGLLTLVERVLNIWQKALDIKKQLRELERLNLPSTFREQLEQHSNDLVNTGAQELAEDIIANAPASEDGRRNELRNNLVFEIKVLARRIDMGARVEVTVPRIEAQAPPTELEEGDIPPPPRQLSEAERMREELARRGALMRDTPQLEYRVLAIEDQQAPPAATPPGPSSEQPDRR